MKISLNLIRHYNKQYNCAPDPYEVGVDQLVKRIGVQLGAVESVEYFGKHYDGIIVANVVSCEKHPNADKLHICLIDDGGVVKDVTRNEAGYVQVVCGAPNVKADLLVAWLPPGITVPSTLKKDPFTLEAREIRGEMSNGMLASPSELGIGDSHEGLLEIVANDVGDALAKPGTEFKKLYDLDDVVIELENKMFTHRPDCFGHLGVARELAGILGQSYTSPDWYKDAAKHSVEQKLELQLSNEISTLAPRFMAQAMSNVTVQPSPLWLQSFLSRVGSKSINNIVDYTNYFMLLTAQPLHAFDYDKLKARSGDVASIGPRLAHEGEELTLLGGKRIKLSKDDIVIATDKEAIALAGVMGGQDTEVDETTKNIVIECATFDMYAIRRTSMRHGLFTDAVTRFSKGQSPRQNDRVLAKIVDEIKTQVGGIVASEAYDASGSVVQNQKLSITSEFINNRLGAEIPTQQMRQLLENVEFEFPTVADNATQASVDLIAPFWRTDIEIAEDIVEEVGRLHGYEELPLVLPTRPAQPSMVQDIITIKQRIRSLLKGAGANEVVTYSFVHGDLLIKVGQNPENSYHIRNALSPSLQYYRQSLTPSLLSHIHANVKAGFDNFALYELGKCHIKGQMDGAVPQSFDRLAFVYAADKKAASSLSGAPFYYARQYLQFILQRFGINEHAITYTPQDKDDHDSAAQYYQPGRAAVIHHNGTIIGRIGEYAPTVAKTLKLPDFCSGFEISLTALLGASTDSLYKRLSKFPSIEQDICLRTDAELTYAELYEHLNRQLQEKSPDGCVVTITPVDIYQAEAAEKKQTTFRILTTSFKKTMTDKEVSTLLETIEQNLLTSIGAQRV